MRKALLIIVRLLLMAGFFLGIFLTIRVQAWWHLLAGPALMLATVPLNNIAIAYGRDDPRDREMLLDSARSSFRFILPIVLFVVAISGVFLVARHASPQFFLLYLLAGIPLFSIVAQAVRGDLPWSIVPLASAFSRLVTFQLGYMLLVVGTVFLALVVGVMGSIMLLITLGNLAWQWIEKPGEAIVPFFCSEFSLGSGMECAVTLTGLHALQLLAVFVMVYYGDRLFDAAAGWVNSYRD